MDVKLIEAFHQYDSFNDIIDNSEVSSKGFEKIIIETIREQFKVVEINEEDISDPKEPDVEEEKAPMSASEIDLSDEQLDFIHRALNGENLFLTAPAGYGKSFTISAAVRQLRVKYDNPKNLGVPSKVAICASTGVSAKLISGRTLHSYLGIGLGKGSSDELYERLITTKRLRSKYYELKALRVLIIDEISMINANLFDKISRYLELIHDSDEPFGSVQIIIIGDLAQLKPVEGSFVLKSRSYIDGNFSLVQLTKCFRQNDLEFQQLLSEARFGKLSESSYKLLLAQNSIDENKFKGIRPTVLFPLNRDVLAYNQKCLNQLIKDTNAELHTYKIRYISNDTKKADTIIKMEGTTEVELCIGAQIMCTTNVSMSGEMICNGSQGTVLEIFPNHIILNMIGFAEPIKMSYTRVIDPDSDEFAKDPKYLYEYMPLVLSYSCSVHKSQGMSCSVLSVNLSKIFTHGQSYTAISRVRSLDGLIVSGLKKSSFICDKEIFDFYHSI